jgi:hypothetical protein
MGAWSGYGYQQATLQFGWRFEFWALIVAPCLEIRALAQRFCIA